MPSGMSLQIIGDGFVSSEPLPAAGRVVIGRSGGCDVEIDVSSISRRHAALTIGAAVTVEDLGSSNGTRVRGERLEPGAAVEIAPNDVIELGSVMLIVQKRAVAGLPRRIGSRGRRALPDRGVMQRLYRLAERVAQGKINVLLLGETGVGKEVVAERIHELSPRADRRLVRLSCAALPENLLESELFGYDKGAFTGADHPKPGLIETAEGGSVFLDEIGELPLSLQPKLLRVLDERAVLRLGSLEPRPIDVRFIAATNRDLEAEVKRGRFRDDLYFRLSGVTLVIPPLRERLDEIPALVESFLAAATADLGREEVLEISDEALQMLAHYSWPGNLRELKNIAERAALLCGDGPVLPEHLPLDKMRATLAPPRDLAAVASADLRSGVSAYERSRIIAALRDCDGNQTRAAKLLGISRMTLSTRMDAYGLPRPRKDKRP
jgi:transcriptional regulator with PAS, ATPase and Fis domain